MDSKYLKERVWSLIKFHRNDITTTEYIKVLSDLEQEFKGEYEKVEIEIADRIRSAKERIGYLNDQE